MISKKDLLVAVLCTFCLTMVLFSTMPVKSAGVYDPWVDVNHDGKINVLDLIKVATGLNTAGDPALNVTVANPMLKVNWPNASGVLVFSQYINSTEIYSGWHYANGYTYVHVMAGTCIPPSESGMSIVVHFGGYFEPPSQGGPPGINWTPVIYTATLTYTSQNIAFTLPVPSRIFWFGAFTANSGTFGLPIQLSYYLTWG